MSGTRLCTHWSQFRCNYGDACSFSHDGPGGPSPRGVYPGVVGRQQAVGVAPGVEARQAAALQVQPPSLLGLDQNSLAALVAAKLKDNLEAALTQVAVAAPQGAAPVPAVVAPQVRPPVVVRPPVEVPVKKQLFCRHWAQFKCNYGDACTFSHDGPGGPSERGVYPGVLEAQQRQQQQQQQQQAQLQLQQQGQPYSAEDEALLAMLAEAPLHKSRAPWRLNHDGPGGTTDIGMPLAFGQDDASSEVDKELLALLQPEPVPTQAPGLAALSSVDSERPKSTRPCAHWAQFKCNYGDACNFSHDGPGGPSPRGVFPAVVQAQAARRAALVQDQFGLGQGLEAAMSQVVQQAPVPIGAIGGKRTPCSHWAQHRCNFGDACKFSHDGPGGPSEKGVYPGVAQAIRTSDWQDVSPLPSSVRSKPY